jgi:hypothetical protein
MSVGIGVIETMLVCIACTCVSDQKEQTLYQGYRFYGFVRFLRIFIMQNGPTDGHSVSTDF